MPIKHTVESLTALIRKQIEPLTADAALAALRQLDGQLITSRILDKLPGGRVEWRLGRQMGHTEVRNRAYITSQGSSPDGVCLILARTEGSVEIVSAWVERENPAYFAGRRQRNALRAEAIKKPELLANVACVMNDIEDLNAKLTAKRQLFAAFVAFGQPLHPDQYELERACGLRDGKR